MSRQPGYGGINLAAKWSTSIYAEFREMCRRYKKRTTIVSEGDSWFAYPPKWLIVGRNSNVISFLKEKERFNFYEMARNGDEIVDIFSGDGKFDILNAISENTVDFLLISGGGNDLVGSYDFEFILRSNPKGKRPADFLKTNRFERKLSQIRNAYADLIDYCSDYSKNPDIKIVTHCYGYAIPQNKPAEFIGGLIDAGPWMYPTLDKLEIPENVRRGIVNILMDSLKDIFKDLRNQSNGRFHYVDSTSLISDDDWIDEIHLKPEGFERVASAIYEKIKELRGS
jgi:hypothetical protein